jgi:hypothetical protein
MKHVQRIFLVAAVLLVPHFAFAARMNVFPSTRAVSIGDLITARVSIDTKGVAINQGQADIAFPSNLLSVVSVSKSSSIFSFWVNDPTNSPANEPISFNAGLPTPGYSGSDGTVVTIVFQAKAAGTAKISLGNAAVRANDGLGTDVLEATGPATFVITAPVAPPPSVVTPTTPSAPKPPIAKTSIVASKSVATLSSKTNPDQTTWYANTSPTIDWMVPSNSSLVEVVVSADKTARPSLAYKETTFEKQIPNLTDGTWYFNLRYKIKGTWSAVSSYVFNVDSTPPVVDSQSFLYDTTQHALIISVKAHDAVSGIGGYRLTIDQGVPVEISGDVLVNGSYAYQIAAAGNHTVVLRVLDKAGNYVDAPGAFSVPQSLLDTPLFMIGGFAIRLLWVLLAMVFVSLLSFLIAIAGLYRLYSYNSQPQPRKIGQRKNVHEALVLLREDLDKNLKALKKARTGQDLTIAETELGHTMHSDINKFEKYLLEQTDLFE